MPGGHGFVAVYQASMIIELELPTSYRGTSFNLVFIV